VLCLANTSRADQRCPPPPPRLTYRLEEQQRIEYASELDARLADVVTLYDGIACTPGTAVIAIAEGPKLFKLLARGFHAWCSAARCGVVQRLWQARCGRAGGVQSHQITAACEESERRLGRMSTAHSVDRRAGPTHHRITAMYRTIKRTRELVGTAEDSYREAEDNAHQLERGIMEMDAALGEQAEALRGATGKEGRRSHRTQGGPGKHAASKEGGLQERGSSNVQRAERSKAQGGEFRGAKRASGQAAAQGMRPAKQQLRAFQ